jgi:hypothetical protein
MHLSLKAKKHEIELNSLKQLLQCNLLLTAPTNIGVVVLENAQHIKTKYITVRGDVCWAN